MAANADLPWNTTRCNRLLRPLSSKLAKLRKELERLRSSNDEPRDPPSALAPLPLPRNSTRCAPTACKPRNLDRKKDPDWMPNAPVGGAKKTYSGRGLKKSTTTQRSGLDAINGARPGQIAFTPLIARTGGRFEESPQFHHSPLRRRGQNKGPLIARDEQIQDLKKQMPADIGNLVKGLSEAYANLLRVTKVEEKTQREGTRSLFGACLRKIPDYIKLEEYFFEIDKEEEDEEEGREVSQEIYTYLEEQFETTPGQGWRAFKQVARAHGTSLLCDAFSDQILGLEALHLLAWHCVNVSAFDEAEKFLWSFLPSFKPMPMPSNLHANLFDEKRSLYMRMVKDFVSRTGRYRFLFDQLEFMVSQELFPLEWLATECMLPVWDRLVRSLADGDDRARASAFRFLEATIFAGVGLPDESLFDEGEVDTVARRFKPSMNRDFRKALHTTFSSLLTVFCSIALVNRSRDDPPGLLAVQRTTWVLDALVVGLLKRNDVRDDLALLGPSAEDMNVFAQRALWTAFASFLVHLEGCSLGIGMTSLDVSTTVGAMNWITSQYTSKNTDNSAALDTFPEFVSSAARGTGRIWKDDGFDQIQRLVQGMLSLSGLRLPHKLWSLKRLGLESAKEFAQNTNEPEHMAYARGIEKMMQTKGNIIIAHSPQKNASPSSSGGFRWEEGIGEWVALTPFAKQEVARTPRKPVRALELLPTPDLSQDEASDSEQLTAHPSIDITLCDVSDDDQNASYHSPPVKKGPQLSTSSLGKRTRASSPIVLIPVKRNRMTPPDSPAVIFYPNLSPGPAEEGPRRSGRSRKEINAILFCLRKNRSRSSLDKGLRNVQAVTYNEAELFDATLDMSASEDGSDLNTSFSSSSLVERQATKRQSTRSVPSSRHRRKSATSPVDDSAGDEPSKTPGLERRRSGRRKISGLREWWKVDAGVVAGEESEDELGFH